MVCLVRSKCQASAPVVLAALEQPLLARAPLARPQQILPTQGQRDPVELGPVPVPLEQAPVPLVRSPRSPTHSQPLAEQAAPEPERKLTRSEE